MKQDLWIGFFGHFFFYSVETVMFKIRVGIEAFADLFGGSSSRKDFLQDGSGYI